jgi:chemotaxis protein CheC
MLRVSVMFSVPRIHLESLEGLLQSLRVESDELHYTLLAATRFRLTEGEVGGYLMIAVGLASLEMITSALKAREG